MVRFILDQECTSEADLSNTPTCCALVFNAERSCHAQTRLLSDETKPEAVFQKHDQHSSAASGHLVSWTDHLKSMQRRYQLFSTNYCVCYLLTEAQPQAERLSGSDSVAVPVQSLFSLRHST